jgi:hypothetical protein
MVDISGVKTLAIKLLPANSAMVGVLLQEPNEMTAEEFIAKVPTWLALLHYDLTKGEN